MCFKSGFESLFEKQSLRKYNHTCFIKKGAIRSTQSLFAVTVRTFCSCYSDNICIRSVIPGLLIIKNT